MGCQWFRLICFGLGIVDPLNVVRRGNLFSVTLPEETNRGEAGRLQLTSCIREVGWVGFQSLVNCCVLRCYISLPFHQAARTDCRRCGLNPVKGELS